MKKLVLAFVLSAFCGSAALAQNSPSASRLGDLQLGVTYTTAQSDYVYNRIRGFGFYGDFDFRNHLGVEVDFHQLSDPRGTQTYERTYEVGGRYFLNYGRFHPYAKAMYGRGVFNFPYDVANLAYNLGAIGGGVDVNIVPRVNVRAEYEYQHWFGFPPNGLTPTLATFGVAYHFPAGKPRR